MNYLLNNANKRFKKDNSPYLKPAHKITPLGVRAELLKPANAGLLNHFTNAFNGNSRFISECLKTENSRFISSSSLPQNSSLSIL